ncbi:MAG: DUF2071 domain-containing protein [Planctomycetaceae bacterium]|nr:DUF2071 domain-containing protein [Planctomycetaceae bacterium]
MPTPAAQLDRLSVTHRPAEAAIGYHRWSNLLFVHWRLSARCVQPLLPPELTLDTWEDDAWIGLVPFYMSGVRPWWSPPVPGISNFCETNVRTYVYDREGRPGVWFFSLEAAQTLAVRIARWKWSLPYYRASMSLERTGAEIRYSSRRRWPGSAGPGCRIEATIGEPWLTPGDTSDASASATTATARPGTLEHFLIERYLLFAQPRPEKLLMGRVHHTPYPLRHVQINHLEDSLLAAAGLAPRCEFCHAAFSDGVVVEVFPLRPVQGSAHQ